MLKELIEQHKAKVREVRRLGRIIGEKICEALSPHIHVEFKLGAGRWGSIETIAFFSKPPVAEKDKSMCVSLDELLAEIEDEEGCTFWVIDLEEGFSYPMFDFSECYVTREKAPAVKQALKRVLLK